MNNNVASAICRIVAEQLGIPEAEVSPQDDIQKDLGADSLDVIEITMAIEEAFSLDIPDEAAETMRTTADVQRYVESQTSCETSA